MTLANILNLVHIVAVTVWIGGKVVLGVLFTRARSARDEGALRVLLSQGRFLGRAVFNPAGIITLAAGVWLGIEGDYDFGEAWISIGFVAVAVGAILGMSFYGKVFDGSLAALESEGIDGANTRAGLNRLRAVSSAELVILLVAVWAMIFKPGA